MKSSRYDQVFMSSQEPSQAAKVTAGDLPTAKTFLNGCVIGYPRPPSTRNYTMGPRDLRQFRNDGYVRFYTWFTAPQPWQEARFFLNKFHVPKDQELIHRYVSTVARLHPWKQYLPHIEVIVRYKWNHKADSINNQPYREVQSVAFTEEGSNTLHKVLQEELDKLRKLTFKDIQEIQSQNERRMPRPNILTESRRRNDKHTSRKISYEPYVKPDE